MATFISVLGYTDTGEEIPGPVSIDLYPAQGNQGLRKATWPWLFKVKPKKGPGILPGSFSGALTSDFVESLVFGSHLALLNLFCYFIQVISRGSNLTFQLI